MTLHLLGIKVSPSIIFFSSADEVHSQVSNGDDSFICTGIDECLPWRSPQQHQPPTNVNDSVCGIWLAPSSLPGAGLGVFAGKDYETGDAIGVSGDIVIPVIDLEIHQPGNLAGEWTFLWDEYTWGGEPLQMVDEGWNKVSGASPGISASMNCFIDLVNVADWQPTHSMPLDRRHDPGAGAITAYDTRWTTALRKIRTGEELFVDYGDQWYVQKLQL